MKPAWQYRFSGLGALICAVSVAMSSYASHGLEGVAQQRLTMASVFAFAHGLSLVLVSRISTQNSNAGACGLMLLGIVLFSGSLASAALLQTTTALAPAGGCALILAWCWISVNFFRSGQ